MQLKRTYQVRYISFDMVTATAVDVDRPLISRLVTGALGALETRPLETFLPVDDGQSPGIQSFRLNLVIYETRWRWTRSGLRRVTREVWRHPLYAMWTGGGRMDAIGQILELAGDGAEPARVVNHSWSMTLEAIWFRVAEETLRWWFVYRNLEDLAAQTGIDSFTAPGTSMTAFLLTARAHLDHMNPITSR